MAVGNSEFPTIPAVAGIRLGVAKAGIKANSNKTDLSVIEICEGASVAGVFTQNTYCAEPVKMCRERMATTPSRYMVINSGNANACTGAAGRVAANKTCEALAQLTGVSANAVLPFSTGVIGEPLPYQKIVNALPSAIADLEADGWFKVAKAIMTTDTRPKGAVKHVVIEGKPVTIVGVSKGAGMIKPNMATMLGYIATDAAVSAPVLQKLCAYAANKSFNRITIDGDTSTNDSCMLIATGKSGIAEINSEQTEAFALLQNSVVDVFTSLAQQIVRDGEGATKYITVNVRGGATRQDCLQVAYAVCHSPLIKTALFASDPNWGRIVAAIGYSGVNGLDADKIVVHLGDVLIVENGGRAESYREAAGQAVVSEPEITINIDLGMGDCSETLWTSDLSHEYIKINAEYRS